MNSLASAKLRTAVFVLVWILLLSSILVTKPAGAVYGPKTQSLIVHVFKFHDDVAAAFANSTYANTLDFIDSPASSTNVGIWERSPYDTFIQLTDYRDIGICEIDVNNQVWPTGVTAPRLFDPATATYKHYYGTNEPWDSVAREFRKAIAYLSNKDMWASTCLGGYGNRIDTIVPWSLAGYTDYANLRNLGYIYDFDRLAAAATLDAAGFTQGTTPNIYFNDTIPGSAQFIRTDPQYGGDLQPLVFYSRIDNIPLRDMGRNLAFELRTAGIPLNYIETGGDTIYDQVMTLYDYNLHTGEWNLPPDIPDAMHFLFHSSQYFGGSLTTYSGGLGYSPNYAGFCDNVYDSWVEQARNAESFENAKIASLKAQERMAELIGVIPAFSYEPVKAFKTGWEGVVKMKGYGPDNRWTYLNTFNTYNTPQNPADNEIDLGIVAYSFSGSNVVTGGLHPSLGSQSDLSRDWKILDLMYDSLICPDPYDSSKDFGLAAESWSFNQDEASATFTLRPGLTFHDGDPVTPEDIRFSLEFHRACGPAVAWAYDEVEPIADVQTQSEDPELGPRDIKVYFSAPSYRAMQRVGYRPILNTDIWMAQNAVHGWGYAMGMTDWNLWNSMGVRDYAPWDEDVDADGKTDFEEDGSGPWVFKYYLAYGPYKRTYYVNFQAFNNYIISQDSISNYLNWSFSQIGDVNQDGAIDLVDGLYFQRAFGTNSAMLPWGEDWGQYNPAADINAAAWDMIANTPLSQGDGVINCQDLAKWGMNYRKEP